MLTNDTTYSAGLQVHPYLSLRSLEVKNGYCDSLSLAFDIWSNKPESRGVCCVKMFSTPFRPLKNLFVMEMADWVPNRSALRRRWPL